MTTVDPTAYFKLRAFDFLSLSIHTHPNSPPSFTLKGRPVARVETVGVVVSVTRIHETLTILVYDGSGCIPCTLFLQSQLEQGDDLGVATEIARRQATLVDLGKLVRV
ncbi:hypothetical protein ZIOFF_070841 [Zingiber officinale]|uniref:CST complex subunit STN1 n=1 Tax=Zingiber officinale TaxID=94328 RepID=A0A8J5EQ53_ZINOF|nr:hypothetical protein ZIOFF_070841 [Zingiber officinale]